MKKILALILSVMLLLSASLAGAESTAVDASDEAALFDALTDRYDSVLRLYANALTERWDVQKLYDLELFPNTGDVCANDPDDEYGISLCFGFIQLDPTREDYQLMIFGYSADLDLVEIYQLYDISADGTIVSVLTAGDRCLYALLGNETDGYAILCEGSNSAFESMFAVYQLKDRQLTTVTCLTTVFEDEEHCTVYSSMDDDGDVSNDSIVTDEEAEMTVVAVMGSLNNDFSFYATMADEIVRLSTISE